MKKGARRALKAGEKTVEIDPRQRHNATNQGGNTSCQDWPWNAEAGGKRAFNYPC